MIVKSIDVVVGRISGFGGVENVISDWFKKIGDEFDLRLVLPIDTGNDSWLNGKKVYRNNIQTKNKLLVFILGFLFTLKYLIKANTDYIVIENYRIVLIASIIKKVLKKKYIVISWMHQSLHIKKNMASCLKYADYHFAIASGIKEQLIQVGVKEKSIFLIYNPVERASLKVNLESDQLKLVYIGRPMLDGQKNQRELFDALSQLKDDFTLTMYGVSEDDKEILDYIRLKKLKEKVILKGWVEDPWSDIESATCLVLTSKYEGLCLVLLESIARGLPVISSNVRVGSSDIVKNGVNGYLYVSGNLEEFRQKLRFVGMENKLIFNRDISESINDFYEENYYKNLIRIFKSFQ